MVEYLLDEDVVVRHEQYKQPLEIYVKRLGSWQPYPVLFKDIRAARVLPVAEARERLQRQQRMSVAEAKKAVP
jgi:hypothetical protein